MSNTIRTNIIFLMQQRQMTVAELAKRAEVSASYVVYVLQNEGNPIGVKMTDRLARGLGVPPNSLVTGIIPDYMDPVYREIEERELLREDPKAFRAMLRVVKNAKETK